eukprot:GDKI01002428.1.p1 GENE.GDKI01002428.1~~GDKI01002428.1.p1  ORF type:complete len:530 (+),score=183.32 GDKI01002428.1:157-1746(+)
MKLSALVLASFGLLSRTAVKAQGTTYDVVIVGSGIGGLGAARRLLDKDSSKTVLVLEAQARTGGRLYTEDSLLEPKKKSGASDMGASWIHQAGDDHPIKRLATRMGAQLVTTDDENYRYWTNDGSKEFTEAETDTAQSAFDDMYEAALKEAEEAEADASVESFFDNANHLDTFKQPLVQSICVDNLEFQYGASVKMLSAQHNNDDIQFDGPEQVWVDGYQSLADALKAGTLHTEDGITDTKTLDVKTSDPVTSVSKNEETGIITVTTKSGKTYSAKHVIVNAPLGVLKAKGIVFTPELSAAKQSAIDKLGFGNVVKMFLKFDTQFWDKDELMFFVRTVPDNTNPVTGPIDETHRGMFREFVNTAGVSGQPTLITFAIGGAADVAEKTGDGNFGCSVDATRCVNAAVNSLKAIFKNDADMVTTPKYLISNWRTNEFFQGAYTYLSVGSTFDDIQRMADSEWSDTLHFVGEHTSKEGYPGTAHGAYMSGVRVANVMLGLPENASIAVNDGGDGEASCAGRAAALPAWLSMM